MSDIRTTKVAPPGAHLEEELEVRGLSQTDFARILGRPDKVVNEIIRGKRTITPETAQELSKALGTTAQLWLNLESTYRLSLLSGSSRSSSGDDIERRAQLYAKGPIGEMLRREWISGGSIDELEKSVIRFFGIPSMDAAIRVPGAAARTGLAPTCDFSPSQLAWLHRARQLFSCVTAAHFELARFKAALPDLRTYAQYPEQIREVPRVLANVGVRLLIIEHIRGTRFDGACIWTGDQPAVVLSLRMDRIDNFWHTLAHELGHVYYEDALSLDEGVDESQSEVLEVERRANEFASHFLVPKQEMDNFIVRAAPLFDSVQVAGFAARLRIHPGIVAGQIHFRTNDYSLNRKLLVKVREHIVGKALTDGWKSRLKVG